MSSEHDEIEAVINQLSPSQREALTKLFGEEPEKSRVSRRGIAPKDKIYECEVLIECKLCGTIRKEVFKSASQLPSRLDTPTCTSCFTVLREKTVEELASIAIRAADGCYSNIKELKKSADSWYGNNVVVKNPVKGSEEGL